MKLTDAYVAGLFDGEGWFQIDRSAGRRDRHSPLFQVHAPADLAWLLGVAEAAAAAVGPLEGAAYVLGAYDTLRSLRCAEAAARLAAALEAP